MSIDTVGGFGGRRSSKRFLLLLIDHFSRYAYICTSKSQNTEEFKGLIDTVLKEGQIETLLMDQYGGFSSKEFEKYLEKKGINRIFTAIDNPASNGLNERVNQTLTNRIRCRINEKNNKLAWTTIAQKCIKEYNDTIHSVTQFPPSYLMYGQEIEILPKELRKSRDFERDKQLAFENSLKDHERNKARYDKNKIVHDFEVSDLVYLENGNRLNREKLDEIRIGPFPISEKISNSIFRIDTNSKKGDKGTFHISKLIPFVEED